MVWPFTSGDNDSSKTTKATSSSLPSNSFSVSDALDSIELAGQDAKTALHSTKEQFDEITHKTMDQLNHNPGIASMKSQFASIPDSVQPYLIASTVFGLATTAVIVYSTRLRRIPSSAYLTPDMLQGKRILRGKVTSVGDSDNFRFYHTPGGIFAGWGWLRRVPQGNKELKNQTLHIRIAGVDAPEGAHFGMPAQPFSQESLQWLRKELNGKTVLVKPIAKDRYDRVVSMAWYPRFPLPILPMKNVSVEMLKVGYGQIYRQAGSEYDGMLKLLEKTEAKAKKQKIGIWSQKNMVSAAEHKKQFLRGGE
ncbi:putative endonuclease lcl3 [Gryganskiella cystojenkinii]|nr:putative endonuclease lcl3 [Gryganskiella cystojenkinii]